MSEVNLSKRAISIEPSLTLQISAKANQLSKEGKDICNLSAGEPDFDAPNEILKATSEAIFDGYTKYGPASGDLELRKAIAKKIQTKNNLNVEFENVFPGFFFVFPPFARCFADSFGISEIGIWEPSCFLFLEKGFG